MTRIRVLDDITINKIAAGEVIENPASVIKELIENAIDAQSTQIYVETKGGGRGLIKIVDNGLGMGRDDLLLSLERNATSKITNVDGLDVLSTLGFRGEALPSIASVSQMQLHSALSTGEGHLIEVNGGLIKSIVPSPRNRGTTIEVRSLFFNVPVRKKFQKSIAWDTGEIHKVLTLFVLCYPKLSCTWVHDDQKQFSFLPDEEGNERLKSLLGEPFAKEAFHVEHVSGKLDLKGKISSFEHHRPNRTGQFLFINGRSVNSPWIARKVLENYGTRLPNHRFPLFVLHLNLPPTWLDVNVHPQKKEVRLREEEKIATFLNEALQLAFERKREVNILKTPHFSQPTIELPKFTPQAFEIPPPYVACESVLEYQVEKELVVIERKIFAKRDPFFYVEDEEGIRVIHGMRALERVMFESLTKEGNQPSVQALLLPLKMNVVGKEKHLLLEHLGPLNSKGIAIRHFGGDTFLIDAIPTLLETSEVEDLVLGYIQEGGVPRNLAKCLKRRALSVEEGDALIRRLFACQQTDFTPNGKRIHYLLNDDELRKVFG